MHSKRKRIKRTKKLIILLLIIGITMIFLYGNDKNDNIPIKKEAKKIISSKKEEKEIKKSIFGKYSFKASSLVKNMSLEEKIGQLFLVRYNINDIDYLSNYYPGGYILFAKDFENHTKESMKEELKNVQTINKYPLIIGVDEEGGIVTRVSRFSAFRTEKFKAPRDYYKEGGYSLLEQMEKEKAQMLKELGINLNLAPVADISTNPADFIYERSFGADKDMTAQYIKNMVIYANNNKINSCLKHFPGYGNNIDTHTTVAIDNRTYESISINDFLPFKAGIEENVPTILVSHNIINSIDSDYPASLSKKVINELRNNLKFTGIIMTDDLAMDAVKEYVTDKKAATLAINAGNDMIITSDFITMYNEVLNSVKENRISEETIDKAVLRIIAWKYFSGIF